MDFEPGSELDKAQAAGGITDKPPTGRKYKSWLTSPHVIIPVECKVLGGTDPDHGVYSIVKPKEVSKFIQCVDKDDARKKAKDYGHGQRPQFHYAHRVNEYDHYHIHNHYNICYHNDPGTLVNPHFTFGPKITKDIFHSRKCDTDGDTENMSQVHNSAPVYLPMVLFYPSILGL